MQYNDGSKAPIWLSGRGRSCLAFVRSGKWVRHSAEGETFSPIQPSFRSRIRLAPGNMYYYYYSYNIIIVIVVVVAIIIIIIIIIFNEHIYRQLQNKKEQSPDITYLVCLGVK